MYKYKKLKKVINKNSPLKRISNPDINEKRQIVLNLIFFVILKKQ